MENLKALIGLAVFALVIASMWKIYLKAGKPGWGCIVPIYNIYLLLKIAGRPTWWLILYLGPLVNFIIHLVVSVDVVKKFGKGAGFGVGFALLPFIFAPILGFGDASYTA